MAVYLRGREAGPRVENRQTHVSLRHLEVHRDFSRPGMLGDIGQGFLQNAENVFAGWGRDVGAIERKLGPRRNARSPLEIAEQASHRIFETQIIENRGTDAHGNFVNLIE